MSIEDRGFASLDTTTKARISSEGGKAAHHYGTARKWTREDAQAASQLAAQARQRKARDRAAAGQRGDQVSSR